jgi:hypothetical protein
VGAATVGRGRHEIVCTVRFRRILSLLTLVAVAAATLTACQTKLGQAASVNGVILSDSDLGTYLQPGAGPYTDSSQQRVVPKILILTTWIRTQLIDAAIAEHGGTATPAELNAANSAVQAANSIGQAEKAYAKYGYTNKFGDLLFDQTVRIVVLVERLAKNSDPAKALQLLSSGQANNAIGSTIVATHAPVEVSPRYGVWAPRSLSVNGSGKAGAPDFVIGSS